MKIPNDAELEALAHKHYPKSEYLRSNWIRTTKRLIESNQHILYNGTTVKWGIQK